MAEDVAGRADDRLIKHERPTGENQHEQAEMPTGTLAPKRTFSNDLLAKHETQRPV